VARFLTSADQTTDGREKVASPGDDEQDVGGVNGGPEEAVLITGVYGSGKSSVAQEMADLLEERNASYALLDLDFLGGFDTGEEGGPTEHGMMHAMLLRNLAAVVGNYLAVGVRFFALAGAIRDKVALDRLEAGLPMPLRVVRLTVPLEEIEERLRHDVTTGRRDDLREAAFWLAASFGSDSKTRPCRTTVRSAR
jgi:hypothetical protein